MSIVNKITGLKIGQKVLFLPAAAAAALILIQIVFYVGNARQATLLERIDQGYFPALEASRDLRDTLASIQRSLQAAVAAADPEQLADTRGQELHFRELLSGAQDNPVLDAAELDRIAGLFDSYFEMAYGVSSRLINQEAGVGIVNDLQTMTTSYNEIRELLDAGMERDAVRVEQAFTDTIASQRQVGITTLLISLICLALLVPVSLLLARGITGPLNSLIALSGRLASGDLSVSVAPSDRSDEVSLLQNSFSSMAESLRKMLENMGSSVNELSTSAAQISATARQSAATAAEQASTAAEVSTSVEEIRQTSKAATETAREVVRVAEEATERGQRGQDAIVEAVSVMQLIGERVGGVAGRILELNEKNAQIGEIVDTVNDLAEQSNLLAVNASIEAAKAGEQGRGFAVVASEVRNLAGQSKRATKQIAALLDEIRTASESTVMATEEASKRTEDGQGAIQSVKKLVAELATVLEASSERARQIAGATGQQNAGINQIAEAMEGVATGGHEAAEGARQLEQSSASLSALAEQLRALTSAYKV